MDIAAWLRGLGLEQYAPAFRDNDVDGEVLPELTADDLISIGVTSVGHRRRLLAAIAALGTEPPTVARSVASATSDATSHPAIDAERRQLTVMFCDLVGSTALSSLLDPEDLREVIGAYHHTVAEIVSGFDGFVAKYMGDGVLIYFGYPQAHEDDAERAVRAGLAVIEAVGRLPARQDLRVRLGIATGLAVVGDLIGEGAAQERGVVGETPNLAARLQALAAPNTLVIGESDAPADWWVVRSRRHRTASARRICGASPGVAGARRERDVEPVRGIALGGDAARRSQRGNRAADPPLATGEERRRTGGADLRRAGDRQVAPDRGDRRRDRGPSRIPAALVLLAAPSGQRALPVHRATRTGRRLRPR